MCVGGLVFFFLKKRGEWEVMGGREFRRVLFRSRRATPLRVVKVGEEAKGRRAPVERVADRAAKYFLPALLLAAGLTFWYTRDWLRTVAVLLVACPCALILATPTAMVAAIGGLARRGILVRGAAVLQQAARADTVVFDKTGTVTEGAFEIVRVLPLAAGEGEVIRLAAAVERASDHVLAKVVVAEAERRGIAADMVHDARVLPGRGVECAIGGRMIRAGNAAFLAEHGIRHTEAVLEEADAIGATAILVAEDDRLAGAILLRDRLREGIREAVAELGQIEIRRVMML